MEARLNEIEIKLSYTEDLVEELNSIVARQQQAIDELQRQLRELRLQVQQGVDGVTGAGSPGTEIPPHY